MLDIRQGQFVVIKSGQTLRIDLVNRIMGKTCVVGKDLFLLSDGRYVATLVGGENPDENGIIVGTLFYGVKLDGYLGDRII